MALAVRMKMVPADDKVLEEIVIESMSRALRDAKSADVKALSSGNA